MMQKCLAKVGSLEVWVGKHTTVKITGFKLSEDIYIDRSEFFLLEKLMSKVVRGFLNGE